MIKYACNQGPRLLLLSLAVLVLWGCCPEISFVAIPPRDYCSDKTTLPLKEESRKKLRAFLLAGADEENIGVNVVDLNAPRYDSLLSLLSDTANLKVEMLENAKVFRTWFCEDPVYGVVDACTKTIVALDPDRPVSFLTDERYWWVFYRKGEGLKQLRVVKNMMRTPKEGE